MCKIGGHHVSRLMFSADMKLRTAQIVYTLQGLHKWNFVIQDNEFLLVGVLTLLLFLFKESTKQKS